MYYHPPPRGSRKKVFPAWLRDTVGSIKMADCRELPPLKPFPPPSNSSHPRISYLSMYIWCSTRVGFFFTNIQPGWLIKRGANELRNFCFSRRNLAKLNFPIICARHLTTCSFSKGLNSVLLHKEDAINYSKLFFVRGWKNFSEAKACPPSMISHGMLILLWTANFLQDNLQLS